MTPVRTPSCYHPVAERLSEIRTCTFKPLRTAKWLALYTSEGLPLQREFLGNLDGFFTT